MKTILATFRTAAVFLIVMTLLTGVAYPVFVTGLAQLFFSHKAGGSLIEQDGEIRGSELLGQSFTSPGYFWGRPSATLPVYNAAASGASNLSPGNPALLAAIADNVKRLKKFDPKNTAPIPVDLVTASASGLDPHISVEAALYQAPRVARARRMKEEEVRRLVRAHEEGAFLGFIGQPRVNVLLLNMALDERQGRMK